MTPSTTASAVFRRTGTNAAKRIFDISIAVPLSVLTLPLLIAIAILIRLTSQGPAIHWSPRVGKDNSCFLMPKFRTMRLDTPQTATHLLKDPDRYVTPVGRLLRKSSLDELPQLLWVITGKLSLVGPRPALFNQNDLIAMRTKYGIHRLTPGITGWAQVNGRDQLSIKEKVRYDYEYMQRNSVIFDSQIIAKTVLQAFRGDGISH
jgi:O-antigen biosynthesis protein WbqP